jgi:hypothetical protein
MIIVARVGCRAAFGGYSVNRVSKLVDQRRPSTHKLAASRQEMLTRLSWHPLDGAKCSASASLRQTMEKAARRLL